MAKDYAIRWLPLARQDLLDTVDYIAGQLDAPGAAADLLDAIDAAVGRLSRFPYSCRVYTARRPLADEVRMLPVKNYAVFYVVLDDAVEIRRMIYARRDLDAQLPADN